MMVHGVENVMYNELGEIELANGEKRRCKVLEIDGSNALVQLFESLHRHQPGEQQGALPGPHHGAWAFSEDMLGRVFDGMGQPIDGGPDHPARKADGHQRPAHEPGGPAAIPRSSFRPACRPLTG